MYAGYPDLYMQFSKKNEFVFQPDWYRGVEYPKEQERGYASNEDLYVPGYFEMGITKGESVVFAASTSSSDTTKMLSVFTQEVVKDMEKFLGMKCFFSHAYLKNFIGVKFLTEQCVKRFYQKDQTIDFESPCGRTSAAAR